MKVTVASEVSSEASLSTVGRALVLNGVTKKYGQSVAIDGVNLMVERGTFMGLLGPNGAGKTTLISLISGLIKSDSGDCQVVGYDTRRNAARVKQMLGVVPQDLALYPELNGWDNLMFFGSMYGLRGRVLKQRVQDALVRVSLHERARKLAVGKYSGGQKRRLNIAAALLHRPQVLILDEPTVGVDPQSRNHIFETLRELNEEGMTILYTTHYMEEVETLCNEVAIIDHGKIIEQGKLRDILERYGSSVVRLKLTEAELARAVHLLQDKSEVSWQQHEAYLTISARHLQNAVNILTTILSDIAPNPESCQILPPSLETVFIQLTGNGLRDE
ncbi:ABC transporter ATP-binding protein [Alicyclobacillus sp. SP_1]|uniref:ABC transporter ATP-binding protein n=1 Tax=Alicyclobacillus sp. SP_1 TaxID=2942475 RepID=UPI002158276F|nr:ABC transporter ATP-binding protein [Alicyclobacillus sp. SP_1]